ncbi:unnamed protein product [Echinostoma caproni]|uniref:DUF3592 domain-containing protein n=1 Tax=Echinostoma caproni TaxID=27848 RepID=A0A183A945_9TREM|nr:unnamed protein product [Echinostoma caproni]
MYGYEDSYEGPVLAYWYLGIVGLMFIGLVLAGLYLHKVACFAKYNAQTCYDVSIGNRPSELMGEEMKVVVARVGDLNVKMSVPSVRPRTSAGRAFFVQKRKRYPCMGYSPI